MLRKGTPASPAVALASSVLPVEVRCTDSTRQPQCQCHQCTCDSITGLVRGHAMRSLGQQRLACTGAIHTDSTRQQQCQRSGIMTISVRPQQWPWPAVSCL
jgi:hypothetical protein